MLSLVDTFLNRITMYRLVLWTLVVYVVLAVIESLFGLLPYSALSILGSTALMLAVGWATNTLFARVWNTSTNVESWWISALILVLILPPLQRFADVPFLFWATVWTMASKFMVAWHRKHLFNPVACGVLISGLALQQSPTWWVGTLALLPAVVIGGLLIVRKLRRGDLALNFLAVSIAVSILASVLAGSDLVSTLKHLFLHSPLIFFATIMLVEPLTTPPTKRQQSLYGAITGLLFAPQFHLGSLYFTPELALLVGNGLSWLMGPKSRALLTLTAKRQLAPDIYDFVFIADRPVHYTAGQYVEWTLSHDHPDSRGNRRSFTLASAPSEPTIRIGVKVPREASRYKTALVQLQPGEQIIAGQVAGDFTLPRDPTTKLVFIAGGIGITPFRSMIMELLNERQRATAKNSPLFKRGVGGDFASDRQTQNPPHPLSKRGDARNITLLYAVKRPDQLVYRDIFDRAHREIGLSTFYTVTDATAARQGGWTGSVGPITPQLLRSMLPDLGKYSFYLSGPRAMVVEFEQTLAKLGIPRSQIKIDYFPGF